MFGHDLAFKTARNFESQKVRIKFRVSQFPFTSSISARKLKASDCENDLISLSVDLISYNLSRISKS